MVEWMGQNFDVFPGFQKIPCYAEYCVIQCTTLTTKVFLNLQFDIRQFHEKIATMSHLSFLSQVHLSKGRGHNVTGKAKSLIVTAINITNQFVGLSIVPLKIKRKKPTYVVMQSHIDKYLRTKIVQEIVYEIVHEIVYETFHETDLKFSLKPFL